VLFLDAQDQWIEVLGVVTAALTIKDLEHMEILWLDGLSRESILSGWRIISIMMGMIA
jgi:hypothetical protein